MLREIDAKRIAQVYSLLVELAEGRFGNQIERSGADDDIEKLIVLVNMMSEEMHQTLSFYSALHAPDSTQEYVRKAIILDQDNRIISMNPTALETLLPGGLPATTRMPFSDLLTASGKEAWKAIAEQVKFEAAYSGMHSLTFKLPSGLSHKVHCSVQTLVDEHHWHKITIISSYESKRSSILLEDELRLKLEKGKARETFYDRRHVLKSFQDTQILQKVHYYIITHLSERLPHQREMARMFGINENKLKYGFKQLYHNSISRFITAERLKKAAMMIQFTDDDMKTIARDCGFVSTVHFSRAFKERYGYSPIQLRRYFREREVASRHQP